MIGRKAMLVLAAAACACSSPSPEVAIDGQDAVGRAKALAAAVRDDDRTAIPEIIGLLESRDPATRLLAIRALHDLTGQTLGYEPFATEHQRAQSVSAWRAALERGDF